MMLGWPFYLQVVGCAIQVVVVTGKVTGYGGRFGYSSWWPLNYERERAVGSGG